MAMEYCSLGMSPNLETEWFGFRRLFRVVGHPHLEKSINVEIKMEVSGVQNPNIPNILRELFFLIAVTIQKLELRKLTAVPGEFGRMAIHENQWKRHCSHKLAN